MEKAIETWGLTKHFFPKREAISNIYLRIDYGEVRGILGPPGAGKTTLLKILMGRQRPSAGSGFCLGHNLAAEDTAIRKKTGYVFGEASMYEFLSVQDMAVLIRKFYDHWNWDVFSKYVERLDISPRRKIKKLSLEEKSMLALILALAPEPLLLLMDEPTLHFNDLSYRQAFGEIVHAEMLDPSKAVVIASSQLEEIDMLSVEANLMCKGQIVGKYRLEDLKYKDSPDDIEEVCRMYMEEEGI